MNGDYPMGAANDPRAPYNQVEPEPMDVKVSISQTLSKSTILKVDDYIVNDWEDCEIDEDGFVMRTGGIDYDFSSCDLNSEFSKQEYDIVELLNVLKEYLKGDIEGKPHTEGTDAKYYLKACEGWTLDESEVIQDE